MSAFAIASLSALLASAAPGAQHNGRPDLVVSHLSALPASLGDPFAETAKVDNVGNRRAGASTILFFLSTDRTSGRQDIRVGSVRVDAIDAGHQRSGTATVAAPNGTKPGRYFVIACADGPHAVKEKNEANNCRASRTPAKLPCRPGDADCDGFLPPADCDNHNAAVHPGATDRPDLNFVDSNCDGLDGDAQNAVFVSGIGNDTAAGTRAHPKRTLGAAVTTAAAQHKDVYATLGQYPERLVVADGVGVYGGYDTGWKRSASNETEITGGRDAVFDIEAAFASNVTMPTGLQLLTLSTADPGFTSGVEFGTNSYGLRAVNSSGLRLERVTIDAGPGAPGIAGFSGLAGHKGGDGHPGDTCGGDAHGQNGGTSPANHPGGKGGDGDNHCGNGQGPAAGKPGANGELQTPDAFNRQGGDGGVGGDGGTNTDTIGGHGYAGDSGVFRGAGQGGGSGNATTGAFWLSRPGDNGLSGSDGHGGGGGGGGGGTTCTPCVDFTDVGGDGGGGGGGGQGGGGGEGGQGGGGSFGIFFVSSAGALVQDSVVTASDGGDGGRGGSGALGGSGGAAGTGGEHQGDHTSSGGDGGLGGGGGLGGAGGGGAGGPSVAILGLDASRAPGTTVSHGAAGVGGGGGHAGANGITGDYVGSL